LGMNFLLEKKKREEADAKVAAFEKRIADYKKALEEENKARSAALEKKAEKRRQDAARAAQARAEWEDETEAALWDRFKGARDRRTKRYSPETLSAKLAANAEKRNIAFRQALEIENQMLDRLESKREALEERLEERRMMVEERLQRQRDESQARFQKRQVVIHAKTQEWVNNKLSEHDKYKEHVENCRAQYRQNLKDRTKDTGDKHKKAMEKVRTNNERLSNARTEAMANLMDKHHEADVRREELNAQKIKNENDIHTFREVKHHTYGELTKRRQDELKKRTDAQLQARVFHLGEKKAAVAGQEKSKKELWDMRQQIAKESLILQDNAAEGFLKIQSEPDERKVIAVMNAMGFDMPTLPTEDDEGEDQGAPASKF